MSNRPRVLMVTRNFPPLTGGMERLNQQVLYTLSQSFSTVLCGPRGSSVFTSDVECKEFSVSPKWRYVLESLFTTIAAAIRFRPQIIYAGSGAAAHAAVLAGALVNAKVVTYLHGLDVIAKDRIYQSCFLPLIRRSNTIIVNSHHTAQLAKQAGIKEEKINIVHPGVTLPDLNMYTQQQLSFRQTYKLNDEPILLAAGRLTARKGLAEFIRNCMPLIVQHNPKAKLIIIGEEANDALKSSTTRVAENIQIAIQNCNLTNNILMLGRVDDTTLSNAYCAADVFIFPVLDLPGDVEGFGMVAIEAAAHGLATVAYATGGVTDAVSEGVSGRLIQPGDTVAFTQAVLDMLSNPLNTHGIQQFAQRFAWPEFSKSITKVLQQHV